VKRAYDLISFCSTRLTVTTNLELGTVQNLVVALTPTLATLVTGVEGKNECNEIATRNVTHMTVVSPRLSTLGRASPWTLWPR
jgi:hypothetical protein